MIVRAFSVFEGIVYHSVLIDGSQPCKPTLEVEAVVRAGDTDAGPLLLPLADYIAMAGGIDAVRACLPRFRDAGRIVDHLGVAHLAFPFWTPILLDLPGSARNPGSATNPGSAAHSGGGPRSPDEPAQ